MDDVLENSKNFIKEKYREVAILENESEIIFQGRFIFIVRHGDFAIHIAPRLKIVMKKDYPNHIPICYDVDKEIKYNHVNSDSSLCLATDFDLCRTLRKSKSIQDYIDQFVIPYFLSYHYYLKTGQSLFGERSHGVTGIRESFYEYLHIETIDDVDFHNLLLWAAKIKKFKKSIPLNRQQKFIQFYLPHIRRLRRLGIPFLRQQYKLFQIHNDELGGLR